MAVELFARSEALRHRLDQLAVAGGAAPVGPDTPLLANLSALENVALVGAFHRQADATALDAEADSLLQTLSIGHCARRRPAELSPQQTFLVQLARAVMRRASEVVITTPFALVPELDSDAPIADALRALGIDHARILDFTANRDRYQRLREAAP